MIRAFLTLLYLVSILTTFSAIERKMEYCNYTEKDISTTEKMLMSVFWPTVIPIKLIFGDDYEPSLKCRPTKQKTSAVMCIINRV